MSRDYVPAAGHRAFTRLYDPVMALTMRESAWRRPVVDRIAALIGDQGTVVDIGAGTGSFAIELSRRVPEAGIVAVDGDPEVIGIGIVKTMGTKVEWKSGRAAALPFPDESVDVCLMSLLLHHLDPKGKRDAVAEAGRVLRSGGALIVADWGKPANVSRAGFLALRMLDGFENTAEHGRGDIPGMIKASGFADVNTFGRTNTYWGTVELLEATGSSLTSSG